MRSRPKCVDWLVNLHWLKRAGVGCVALGKTPTEHVAGANLQVLRRSPVTTGQSFNRQSSISPGTTAKLSSNQIHTYPQKIEDKLFVMFIHKYSLDFSP